ncbi:hypothetical protein [Lapillicoccus jejuensis]|uniref:Uncharacterized protein n=1 Tax=Lapillicoccus jejuensis TaxID=402171 RepID=A0A542DVY0_9MICO|nr:hypothetical protein [Lapillicoccus jejuensis]TQJ07233.1 hypothetical protein FB458_0290 [Lapillicoccus jejuensis]
MGQRNDVDDLTPEQNARLKRAWRRIWLMPLIMVPVMFVVITLNDRLNPPHPRPGHHPLPTWVPWVVLAVLILVLPVEYWFVRRRFFHRPTTARALMASGDRQDIRRVVKAPRRGDPLADSDRPIAQAYVNSAARQLRTAPFFLAPLLLLGVGALVLAVVNHQPTPWLMVALMVIAVGLSAVAFVQLRRAMTGARAEGIVTVKSGKKAGAL